MFNKFIHTLVCAYFHKCREKDKQTISTPVTSGCTVLVYQVSLGDRRGQGQNQGQGQRTVGCLTVNCRTHLAVTWVVM